MQHLSAIDDLISEFAPPNDERASIIEIEAQYVKTAGSRKELMGNRSDSVPIDQSERIEETIGILGTDEFLGADCH